MTAVRVATLNVYFHPHNRWRERLPLLVDQISSLRPQVLALQEVDRERDGDHAVAAGRYEVLRAREQQRWRYPRHWDGLTILYDPGAAELVAHEVVPLTYRRLAQLARFRLAGGGELTFANMHLHHGGAAIRARQTARVLERVREFAADATVIAGDLNGGPEEPLYELMAAGGYRSAHVVVHGAEPPRTFPSGLESPGTTPELDAVLDYVWVDNTLAVRDAGVAFDLHDPDDRTLYPSDHFGVFADLEAV
jgi:endonuclease/exonuclease/phosphatase family metal-dependent hydrolase